METSTCSLWDSYLDTIGGMYGTRESILVSGLVASKIKEPLHHFAFLQFLVGFSALQTSPGDI